MHVYIDDSGDGGFKFSEVHGQGSSECFVLAACVFRETWHIEDAVERMERCAQHNHMRAREFKYARVQRRADAADCFFRCIAPATFDVRALVVRKSLIWSSRLLSSATAFKREMHEQLLTHTFGQVQGAKVFIDGKDMGPAGFPDAGYYQRAANRAQPGAVAQVRFVDSETSRPIQLADMLAGAIRRAVTSTATAADEAHLATFRHRAHQPRGTFWNFK